MEYKIVYSAGWYDSTVAINELQKKITQHIKDGWEPKGGVSITCNHRGSHTATQAMVKMR